MPPRRNDPRNTIGREKLDAWLRPAGRTATALAEAVGVSQPTVSEWRTGATRPREEHRRVLQSVCGIPVSDWEIRDEWKIRRDREKRIAKLAADDGGQAA